MESISEEIKRLRQCVRDLVALSALPSVWLDKSPAEMAGGFVDMLRSVLRPDLVYVRLNGPADGVTFEAACADGRSAIPAQVEEIGRALAPWLTTEGYLSCTAIPNPVGSGRLQMAVLLVGLAGEYGVVAVGSRQPEFPTDLDRLLLDVSIYQAVIALQEVRLLAALHQANVVKDQWLVHEQFLRAGAEAAREQTTTILERITDLFVALDHDWRFTYRNWAAEQLLQGMRHTRAGLIGTTMAEICQEIVEIIPSAWQYPDAACAQIMLAGQTFATNNFTETRWKQSGDIHVHGERIGAVEVYYLAEKPERDEGPFLKEERSLLDTIATLLGEIIGRKLAEAERAGYAAQLQAMAEASLAINSARSLTAAARIVTEKARDIIGAHQSITSFTIDDNWAQAITAISLSEKYAAYRGSDIRPDGPGIYRLVCQTNRPMRMTQAELAGHAAWREFGREARWHPPQRGWLAAPLVGRDSRNIGLIQLSDKYEGEFTADDEAILVQLAQMASIATENAQLFAAEQHHRQQLQSLSQRLLEVQETERRYIARELHDEIGQLLTSLKLTLDMSLPLATDTDRGQLHGVQTVVHDLIARVRDLSLALRPAMLDDLGLLPALLWHVERYTAQTNIQVAFQHTGLEGRRFGTALETAAFRLVQEALTNVARHAQVTTVTVRIWSSQDTLGVQIEDHGKGFDPQALPAPSSGIAGMRERALALGGQLSIESAPDSGTRVMAEWPLSSTVAASSTQPPVEPRGHGEERTWP